jgi:hypothetical protein
MKKKPKKGEVDYKEIEAQIREWESEFETELRNKDTGKDVSIRRNW